LSPHRLWIGVLLLAQGVWGRAGAADTLRVMTYNLMYFGASTTDCTPAINVQSVKEGHLRTIVPHIRPHIIGFQEVGPTSAVTLSILQNVLNTAGETRWSRANLMNPSGSSIASILYYDNQKLGLSRQFPISTSSRDIMHYRLYHRQIPPTGDTIWLNVLVLHLKAGSTPSDAATREQETAALMTYLDLQNLNENLIVMGDFNVTSSSETAYSQLVNHAQANHRLYDPINRPGTWNNNSSFALWHTQSTRSTGTVCFSGGGLDDRFDQILVNRMVLGDSTGVRYIPASYRSVGNDGQRFQGNVQSPFNASVPVAVANALYNLSDHLPVVLDLRINTPQGASLPPQDPESKFCQCGISPEGMLVCRWNRAESGQWNGQYRWSLSDPGGRELRAGTWWVEPGQTGHGMDVRDLPAGMYLLKVVHTDSGLTHVTRHFQGFRP